MDIRGAMDSVTQWGGAMVATGWMAAVRGRLLWHVRLARKGVRGIVSWELAWELPTVLFAYYVGTALATVAGFKAGPVVNGIIAVVSYLGPAGIVAVAQAWWSHTGKPDIDL